MSTGYAIVLIILVSAFLVCALSAMFIGVSWWPLMLRSTHQKKMDKQFEKLKEACKNSVAKAIYERESTIRKLKLELLYAQSYATKIDDSYVPKAKEQFTPEEIRTLLQLCHPDKHGGKESAMRITQKLNKMRR